MKLFEQSSIAKTQSDGPHRAGNAAESGHKPTAKKGVFVIKKYKVYDLYEGKDVVGYADTLNDVKRLVREWFRDTDSECCMVYAELNTKTGKYRFSQYKPVKI